MIYVVQRLVRNEHQWVRPSRGRLGPPGEGDYVKNNGFGWEDWNINLDLAVGGYIYGYAYYTPASKLEGQEFSFAFVQLVDGNWYLVGFYVGARFVASGAPKSERVLRRKMADLRALGNSVGPRWRVKSEAALRERVLDVNQYLQWRVRVPDVLPLPDPVLIPPAIFQSKYYRIVRPTMIDRRRFERLMVLGKASIPEAIADDEGEDVFPEGRILARLHRQRERDPELSRRAKAVFLKVHGRLFCQVCGFDFEEKYGQIGGGYIEAHHTVPVRELRADSLVKVSDMALVCANCHRMLHRKRPWLTPKQLRRVLAQGGERCPTMRWS